MAHFFGRHEFSEIGVCPPSRKQRVSVFEASLGARAGCVIRFGLVEDVPRVNTAREEVSHRVAVWTRSL